MQPQVIGTHDATSCNWQARCMASNRHGVASNSGIMITGRQLTESGLMLNKFTIFWPKSITAGLMIAAENCPDLHCKTIAKLLHIHCQAWCNGQ